MLPNLDPIWSWLILIILGITSVLNVLESAGILHYRIARWLNRNKLTQNIEILRELGVDVDILRRRNSAAGLPEKSGNLQQRIEGRLKQITIRKKITVGSIRTFKSSSFVDLMGASTNPSVAKQFARDLVSFWHDIMPNRQIVSDDRFDFVATPKDGSPILGYEFANLMRKPLVLYTESDKFASADDDFRAHFDCEERPAAGSRVLIVGDSSTGGSKALALIDALRRFGYQCSEFLVVFEPTVKKEQSLDARTRLADAGVNLHSIIQV